MVKCPETIFLGKPNSKTIQIFLRVVLENVVGIVKFYNFAEHFIHQKLTPSSYRVAQNLKISGWLSDFVFSIHSYNFLQYSINVFQAVHDLRV